MISNFIREAGFGVFPTALFGFLAITIAVFALLRPTKDYKPLQSGFSWLTLLSALFGTVMGLHNTFRFVVRTEAENQFNALVTGCSESIKSLILAVVLLIFATLIATIARYRHLGQVQSVA